MNDYVRELIAIKLLELAMLVATKNMELAIAKGIAITFPDLAKKTIAKVKNG